MGRLSINSIGSEATLSRIKDMMENIQEIRVRVRCKVVSWKRGRYNTMFVIQISPYPPEAGSDYHEQLAYELVKKIQRPILVLAGLTHLDIGKAVKLYGIIEKRSGVVVYRAFWVPRIAECKNLSKVLKFIIASLKALAQTIVLAKKHSKEIITHFHYGLTTWPGAFLGEHYPLGMVLARIMGAKVVWIIHAFLVPYQLRQEAKDRRLPLLLVLLLTTYYLLLAKIAAFACHKVVVLVDSPNAPITSFLKKFLGKNKVFEQVHPLFKPLVKFATKSRNKITIACLGYIRREKGYHVLLKWLANLKNRNPCIYDKIDVIIAGTIDRKKREDIEYLKSLLSMKQQYELKNVKFIIKRLNKKEFQELLAKTDIIWCAYTRKYGPSGILAWAKAYRKRAIIYAKGNLWLGDKKPSLEDFSYHVKSLLEFVRHA